MMVLGKAKRRSQNSGKAYRKDEREQDVDSGGVRAVQRGSLREEASSRIDRKYADPMGPR